MIGRFLTATVGVLAICVAVTLYAQEPTKPPAKPEDSTKLKDKLTLDEQILAKRFADFEQSLLRIRDRLAKSGRPEDRDQALLIDKALEKAREISIHVQYEQLVDFLKDKKLGNLNEIEKAKVRSQKLAADLQDIMNILRNSDRSAKLREERLKLEEMLRQLEALILEQRNVRARTEASKADPKDLKAAQGRVTDATAKLGGKDADGKAKEGKHADAKDAGKGDGKQSDGKDTGKAGAEKSADAKDNKGGDGKESKQAEAKGGDGKEGKDGKEGDGKDGQQANAKDAGKQGGDPKDGKQANAKDAKDGKGGDGKESKAGDAKDGKGGDGKESKSGDAKDGKGGDGKDGKDGKASEPKGGGDPKAGKQGDPKVGDPKVGDPKVGNPKAGDPKEAKPGEPKGGKGGDPKAGDPKAGDAKGGEPKGGDPKDGKPSDSKAGGKSGESKQAEAKGGKSGESKPMEGSPSQSASKSGQPPQGDQPQAKGDGQKQPPPKGGNDDPKDDVATAKKKIQDANEYQQKAEEKIGAKKNDEAVPDQDKAIDKLNQAKKKLEEILRQLREEELERLLAALQARCERMLAMQLRVLDGTMTVHKSIEGQPNKKPSRNDEQDSLKLSDDEKDIVVEATKAIEMLEAEGTAVAFPEVFQQIREDMKAVQRRLGTVDAGKVTIKIEEDIVDTLKEMIEALKKAKQEMDNKKNPPSPPKAGPTPPPADQKLLDAIAELKMIRSMQIRVNGRTKAYGEQYQGEQANETNIRREVRNLAERQLRIFEVASRIARGDNQ